MHFGESGSIAGPGLPLSCEYSSKGTILKLFLLWQWNWWCIVLSAKFGLGFLALISVVASLYYASRQRETPGIIALAVVSLVLGILAENSFVWLGWVSWAPSHQSWIPPWFLLLLWLNMALAWDFLMAKFSKYSLYALFLFTVSPAYYGGEKLGLIEASVSLESWLGIGFIYCVVLYFITSLRKG